MKTRNGLFADVPEEQWNDWHWQVRNRAETLDDLKKIMTLTGEEEEGIKKTLGKLRMAITPYYLSLIDLDDPYDPIRKMAIPRAEELEYADYEDADPLPSACRPECRGSCRRSTSRAGTAGSESLRKAQAAVRRSCRRTSPKARSDTHQR